MFPLGMGHSHPQLPLVEVLVGTNGNGVFDNTAIINAALITNDHVKISKPGIYVVSGTIWMNDGQSLEGVPGVVLKRLNIYKYMIANFQLLNYGVVRNTDITVKNITFDDSDLGAQGAIINSVTANGIISFTYADNIFLENINIINGNAYMYGLHFQSCTYAKVKNYSYIGIKEGWHIHGGCHYIDINGFYVAVSADDTSCIATEDYPNMQGRPEDISDITIRNGTSNGNPSVGFFCRILTGSWADWGNGKTYVIGNMANNAGNIYKMVNDASIIAANAPIHSIGDSTGADGITWRWVGTGTHHIANISNLTFENINLADGRLIYRTINADIGYDYGEYPGTEDTSYVEGINIINVITISSIPTTPFFNADGLTKATGFSATNKEIKSAAIITGKRLIATELTGQAPLILSAGTATEWKVGPSAGTGPGDSGFGFYNADWGAGHYYLPILFMRSTTGEIIIQDGTVGIGIDPPLEKLHIFGTAVDPSLGGHTGIFLIDSTMTTRLEFGAEDGAPYAIWIQNHTAGGTAYPIKLNPLGGDIYIGNLAGIGNRPVYADTNGKLYC